MRILLADDDDAYLAWLVRLMKKLAPEADVVTATTGTEALRVINDPEGRVDLAILDNMMPGHSGFTVRAVAMRKGIVAVLVSSAQPIAIGAQGVTVVKGDAVEPAVVRQLGVARRRGTFSRSFARVSHALTG